MSIKNKYTKQQLEEMIGELQTSLVELNITEKNGKKIDRNHKIECDICGGHYTAVNASKHMKTRRHINEVEHMKQLKRILRARTIEGRTKI